MSEDVGFNKRIAPRKQVFGEALILTPGGKARCIIRDLSATGAKIGVSHEIKLPEQFELLLLKTKSIRRVALRWRNGDHAGVQFCQGETAPTLPQKPASGSEAAGPGFKSSWRGRR